MPPLRKILQENGMFVKNWTKISLLTEIRTCIDLESYTNMEREVTGFCQDSVKLINWIRQFTIPVTRYFQDLENPQGIDVGIRSWASVAFMLITQPISGPAILNILSKIDLLFFDQVAFFCHEISKSSLFFFQFGSHKKSW